MAYPSRYSLLNGQDESCALRSGSKRARVQPDLPSDLTEINSRAYQRHRSDSRHSPTRQGFTRENQAPLSTAANLREVAQPTKQDMLNLFDWQFRVLLEEALTPLSQDTARESAAYEEAGNTACDATHSGKRSGCLASSDAAFAGTTSSVPIDLTASDSTHTTPSHGKELRETQSEPKKRLGRPKKLTGEPDIDIILLIGSRSDGARDYRAIETAPTELRSFLLECIKAAYWDTPSRKNSYMNIVAKEHRAQSAASPRCVNIRMNHRQRTLDPETPHACRQCDHDSLLCARVLHDGHSLKLCIVPAMDPGENTWKDPGFWLEGSLRFKAPDRILADHGAHDALHEARETIKLRDQEIHRLRCTVKKLVDNSTHERAIRRAQFERIRQTLDMPENQFLTFNNA